VKSPPLSERCLPESPLPIVPFGTQDVYQIVQTADAVVIAAEVVHDVRVIRLNAKHLPAGIRVWLGDSIGHWEGATLVVDTTNFRDDVSAGATSSKLHIIERFTRTGPKTLLYRATVEDPEIFTKPYTVEYPLNNTGEQTFEYACHEGNSAMPTILETAK